jgi:hypothetical protein
VRFEAVAKGFEFAADLKMIVDLPVKDDAAVTVARMDRLVARVQVDNLQPGCTHREKAGREDSLLVRTTMKQRVRGFTNATRGWRPVFMCEADNSAQSAIPSPVQNGELNSSPKHPDALAGTAGHHFHYAHIP